VYVGLKKYLSQIQINMILKDLDEIKKKGIHGFQKHS
jgi:hypothetical protein